MAEIGVVQYGLGPIGQRIVRLASETRGLRIDGAVDVDPRKIGHDLGELIGLERRLGVPVSDSIARVTTGGATVALHSTGSSLARIEGQLVELMDRGLAVISTCEELAYPWHHQRELATRLDEHARARGVQLLGTGVNPGFVMDTLPLVLTLACQRATAVRVRRVVDASRRRLPLQKKIGAGMAVGEFRELAGTQIRHVGLPESLAMIAAGLGWRIGEIEDTIEPVIAERERRSAEIAVERGRVAGVHQVCRARTADGNLIEMDLTMAIEAECEGDGVEIDGHPPLRLEVLGGVQGDDATAAVAINALPRLLETRPGLRTMLDLPLPRAIWGGIG